MKRKEFERVWPEEVGISSASLMRLLDRLEAKIIEPHGLMIMRGGKICAEGWWSPYAPGIHHGQQSQSKTYAATAIGLAYTEGLLDLEERIVDIFSDKVPQHLSENLKKMTIHHVLSMSCGMDKEPEPTENWIRDFLSVEVSHEPGTAFMYNSTASAILVAIVEKKTGLGLQEYLKTRLFDKIGIDSEHIDWICMPDGTPFGGGGIFSTTEDNLRLMKLYADGGVWEGERILAEDFVKRATSFQIATGWENLNSDPAAKQDPLGYGYQIWRHEARGVYRATGAMGQYTIVDPYRDVIIAFTESDCAYDYPDASSKVLNMFWDFLDEIAVPESIVPLEASNLAAALKERMTRLSLPAPKYQQYSPYAAVVNENVYRLQDRNLYISFYNMIATMAGVKKPVPLELVQFIFADDSCIIKGTDSEGKEQTVKADMRGGYQENYLGNTVPNRVLASAYWEEPNSLYVVMRWIETAEAVAYHFRFCEEMLTVSFTPTLENFSRKVVVSQGKREDAALC